MTGFHTSDTTDFSQYSIRRLVDYIDRRSRFTSLAFSSLKSIAAEPKSLRLHLLMLQAACADLAARLEAHNTTPETPIFKIEEITPRMLRILLRCAGLESTAIKAFMDALIIHPEIVTTIHIAEIFRIMNNIAGFNRSVYVNHLITVLDTLRPDLITPAMREAVKVLPRFASIDPFAVDEDTVRNDIHGMVVSIPG